MTPLRYIFGSIWVLFVWFMTAVIVGCIIAMFLPGTNGDMVFVGIGTDWRNLPGTALGFFAARQSWRMHVRGPTLEAKQARSGESRPPIIHKRSHDLMLCALLWSLPSGISSLLFHDFLQQRVSVAALCGTLVFPALHFLFIAAAIYYWRTERRQKVTPTSSAP